jgi:hypothetical protein
MLFGSSTEFDSLFELPIKTNRNRSQVQELRRQSDLMTPRSNPCSIVKKRLHSSRSLAAFGSSYYHLFPNNARLVQDRLPMTIAFEAMMPAIISERISLRAGLWLLPLLLLVGMGSVLQWYASERGVQVICASMRRRKPIRPWYCCLRSYFRSATRAPSDFSVVVGFYVLAKALETLDKPIFCSGTDRERPHP